MVLVLTRTEQVMLPLPTGPKRVIVPEHRSMRPYRLLTNQQLIRSSDPIICYKVDTELHLQIRLPSGGATALERFDVSNSKQNTTYLDSEKCFRQLPLRRQVCMECRSSPPQALPIPFLSLNYTLRRRLRLL